MGNNNREKKLLKNTLIISIGQICTKFVSFLLLPLYTGILTTTEYGTVDLLYTLVSLLLPIITFQVEQAIFRELIEARENDESKKRIISSGITSVTLQCIAFLVLFFIISPFIHNNYKYFLMVNVLIAIYNSLMLQIARGLGDNIKYAIGGFISATSTIIFNIIFLVIIKWGVNGMLLGTLLGQVIGCIFIIVSLKIHKYYSIKYYRKKTVKSLWKYSLPLIPNAISWWIFQSSDRVIVSAFLGLSMTGILGVASKFSNIYTTMYNIFDRSWFESITLHFKDKDIEDYFNHTFNIILKLFLSIDIVLIAFMPFIYPILINKNYSYGYGIVPILLISCFFNVIQGMVAVVYAAHKDTKSIAKTSLAAAILNAIIHFALIKFVGLYAAALSTLGAFIIIALYRIYDIRKKYLSIKIKRNLIVFGIISLSLVIPLYYINNIYLNIVSAFGSVIFACLINKNAIRFIKELILKKVSKNKGVEI